MRQWLTPDGAVTWNGSSESVCQRASVSVLSDRHESRAQRFRQWMEYSSARLSSSELSRLPRGRQDSLPNQPLRIELLNARNDQFRRHVDEYAVKESDNKSGLAG